MITIKPAPMSTLPSCKEFMSACKRPTSETQLKNQVKRWVNAQGGFCLKTSDRFTSGIPDLWVCIHGRGVWIELKTKTGKVSAIQQWTIDQIRGAEGEAVVCHSLDEVKTVFE